MDQLVQETQIDEEAIPQNEAEILDPHQKYLLSHYHSLAQDVKDGKKSPEELAFKMFQIHLALERRADRDGLLRQFLNKKGFPKALERELEIIKRYNLNGSLLFLDIDHFKKVNDTLGHDKGDLMIKTYAQVIMLCTRKSDLWGRIGGDELAAFLMGSDASGAKIVAERIREEIIKEVKRVFPDIPWEQTVSIGIAEVKKAAGQVDDTIGELIYRADQAMYKAKEERNKTVVFSEELSNKG
ncbi:MAG: GGDEF domain-containing protein [Patescibacteria group bacterium]|nr:GGDEF domain-containing protein [Patescibacteria group bacterium]